MLVMPRSKRRQAAKSRLRRSLRPCVGSTGAARPRSEWKTVRVRRDRHGQALPNARIGFAGLQRPSRPGSVEISRPRRARHGHEVKLSPVGARRARARAGPRRWGFPIRWIVSEHFEERTDGVMAWMRWCAPRRYSVSCSATKVSSVSAVATAPPSVAMDGIVRPLGELAAKTSTTTRTRRPGRSGSPARRCAGDHGGGASR